VITDGEMRRTPELCVSKLARASATSESDNARTTEWSDNNSASGSVVARLSIRRTAVDDVFSARN
jgi:hypothetical protein